LRHSRRAALTHAGRRFLDDARAALAAFDQACRNARLAEQGELGELSVGFTMHAAHTVVPGLTRRFVEKHPMVRIELRETLPNLLPEAVLTGRFDAAITFDAGPVRGLSSRIVHKERLCLALHPSHRLAARATVLAAELADEPLIAAPAETAPTLHDAIVGYCRAKGFEPIVRLEAQLQQTVVNLVAEKLGVALVPASLSKITFPEVIFRDLDDPPVVAYAIVWRSANLNPALRPLLAEVGAMGAIDG